MRLSSPLAAVLLALVLAGALSALVRAAARRFGMVAQPKSDRWHRRPTAMMGGVAIVLATGLGLVAVRPAREGWILLGGAGLLFLLGLVDDLLRLKPYQKLVGQVVAASLLAALGLLLPWTGSMLVNLLVTLFWLVGITNALNMLDNMDGLAAGTAAIGAGALAVNAALNGQPAEVLMLAVFGGALLGFLVFNHHPASLFMGDCGSMFVGFFLAGAAVLSDHGGGRSRSIVAVLAVPVLVLAVPIFDTTFVTLVRKLVGRAASQGGRDHTSHRLVALGLSERDAVWLLWSFAALGGALALGSRRLSTDVSLAAIGVFVVLLAILGVHLAGVRVYAPEEVAASRRPLVSFLVNLAYKRRVFEVALDLVLVVLAYYLSYLALFGPARPAAVEWTPFVKTLPVIVAAKLVGLLGAGVYRGTWRYASLADVFVFARGALAGSLLAVLAMVYAFRFEGLSRRAFVLDGVLLLLLVGGSRFTFRVIRRLLPLPQARGGSRALVFGAGDGGELVIRELRNNTALGVVPVAIYDDDAKKEGTTVQGLRVHRRGGVVQVCRRLHVEEVFLSTRKLSRERVERLLEECALSGARLRRIALVIETLEARHERRASGPAAEMAATPATKLAGEKPPVDELPAAAFSRLST